MNTGKEVLEVYNIFNNFSLVFVVGVPYRQTNKKLINNCALGLRNSVKINEMAWCAGDECKICFLHMQL